MPLRWWGLALTALAAALCFVPLFNLLAFEFAFAVGLLAAPCAMGLAWRAVRANQPDGRPATASRVGEAALRAAGMALLLLLLPLAVISLNAVRIQNCNYLEGLAFYLLLPGVSVVVAALWGAALAGMVSARAGRWPLRLLAALLLVGSVALNLWRFYAHPPVDAFNPFFGYWPGAIYDEVVPIGARLVVSRLEDLAYAVAALGLALASRVSAAARVGVMLGAVALCFGARTVATAYDLHRDAEHIARALGGHLRTAHFDVYFPADWKPEQVAKLGVSFEFEYTELAEFFGVAPERIEAWLYRDTAQKKRLMGAARTRVAKPWRRAIQVHAPAVGQQVIRHELAHVFSAEVTPAPFHMPLWAGVVPHMPLIEGLAEAASWPAERLDLHQWSAALLRLPGMNVDLRTVLSPTGFYAHNGRVAYTLCGSFLAFYGAREGRDALLSAYREGRFEPTSLSAAVTAWQAMLDGLPEDPRVARYARDRFDRPAIFGKTCAHEIAALQANLERALAAGGGAPALAVLDQVLGHLPDDVDARLTRVGLLFGLGRAEEAETLALALAADARAGAHARHAAAEWAADLRWHRGDGASALVAYTEAAARAFDRDEERRLAVKLAALQLGDLPEESEAAELTRALLMGVPGTPVSAVAARLDRLATLLPDWPVGLWLRARHAAVTGDAAAARVLLARIDPATLPHPSLALAAAQLAAQLDFAEARYTEAAAGFEALTDRARVAAWGLSGGEVAELSRWARRSRHFAAAAVDNRPAAP